MARFSGISKGWRITAIVGIALLLVVGIICTIAGIKSAQEDIGFFDALGQIFGITAETAGEVIENGGETAGEVVEDAVETVASII